MNELSAKRLPTHYQIRHWRALLLMLALHNGLIIVYFLLLPAISIFVDIYADLGAELPALTRMNVAMLERPFAINILLLLGLETIDALVWLVFDQYSSFLARCWAVCITIVLFLLIVSIPVSLFLPLFVMPSLIPSS